MIRRTCDLTNLPPHKKIPLTTYTVDCFNIDIPNCTHYFLSHFHADHYMGLSKKFDGMLFSSHTTCNLVQKQLRVNETNIKRLHMHRWYIIEPNRYVYLADANHCPGAVCFVFKIDKKFLFHCGDFRACDEFYNQFDRVDNVFVYNLNDEIVEEHRVVDFFSLEVEITAKLIQYKGQNETNYVINDKNFFWEDKNTGKNVIDVNKNVNDMQNIFNINNGNEVSIENAFENIYKTNNINAIEKEKIIDKNLKEKTNEIIYFTKNKRNLIFENKKIHTNNNTKLIKYENKIDPYKKFNENAIQKMLGNKLNFSLLDIKYENIYLDNTYDCFKPFPTQEEIIHKIIQIIETKLSCKNVLVPIKYKFLFATYSIGKEKIFLSVAEYFNYKIKLEKRKLDFYSCYDKYSFEKINNEIIEIVDNYKKKNKTLKHKNYNVITTTTNNFIAYNLAKMQSGNKNRIEKYFNNNKIIEKKNLCEVFIKKEIIENQINSDNTKNIFNIIKTSEFDDQRINNNYEHIIDKTTTQSTNKKEKDDNKDSKEINMIESKQINNTKRTIFNSVDKHNVFNRCTIEQSNNQIELISMMHTNKFKIQEICKKYKEDRICVIVGSGWNNKTVYYDHIKENGSVIKNGIELIYLPYSEHSSNEELINFRNKMKYHKIINTVKNTWAHE